MTRYILDTNILSHLVRPLPAPALIAWMGAQADADLYLSALTVAEIRRGILDLPVGAGGMGWTRGSRVPRARRPCSPAGSYPSTPRRDSPGPP